MRAEQTSRVESMDQSSHRPWLRVASHAGPAHRAQILDKILNRMRTTSRSTAVRCIDLRLECGDGDTRMELYADVRSSIGPAPHRGTDCVLCTTAWRTSIGCSGPDRQQDEISFDVACPCLCLLLDARKADAAVVGRESCKASTAILFRGGSMMQAQRRLCN